MFNIAELLGDMAGLAALQQQPDRAMRLSGAAEKQFETIGVVGSIVGQAYLNQLLVTARQVLGEETAASAIAQGRELSLEETIAYALQEG